MRRLAESTPELTAEMSAREAGRTSQVGDIEWLRVASVDQIPGPQQVTLRRNNTHPSSAPDRPADHDPDAQRNREEQPAEHELQDRGRSRRRGAVPGDVP
jgi:hypothetical protein